MNLNRRLPSGRTRRRPAARTTGLLAATASLLVLTACGSDDGQHHTTPEASSSAGEHGQHGRHGHNAADVDFASEMIPHHRQAVEMAELAGTRASSAKVKELSEKIEKAQAPEIRTMTGWLKAWDEKVPAEDDSMTGMDHGGGHEEHGDGHEDHGGSGTSQMPGMMSAEQLDGLKKSKGRDFDRSFLTMMVDHHKGAVTMATAEKKGGTYGPAKRLADAVIAAQSKEISEMNKLLGKG